MDDQAARIAELERIQALALDHAIEEIDAAHGRGLDVKTDRGDRGFLTGMASKSMSVAVKIEQFLAMRRGDGSDPERAAASERAMVSKARAEVTKVLERAGVGNKPRR